jgi:hypothetical protein
MNQQDAIAVAREFIATCPKEWQQMWPTKDLAVKLRQSRRSSDQIWEVRSLRRGLDISNIAIEISPSKGHVVYACIFGGRSPDDFPHPKFA